VRIWIAKQLTTAANEYAEGRQLTVTVTDINGSGKTTSIKIGNETI
jgi:signal recognition particle GTPase